MFIYKIKTLYVDFFMDFNNDLSKERNYFNYVLKIHCRRLLQKQTSIDLCGLFRVVLFLFRKYSRLMPVYGLMIAFHTFVFLHLADGPLWKKIAIQESDYCLRNWWSNVLFINNYVDADHPVCNEHVFYCSSRI